MPLSAHSIERFRSYLRLLARMQQDAQLQGKLDPSDLVQQTFLQAHQAWDGFHGKTDTELAAWLRQILVRNLAHATRDFHREKRDVNRERSLEQAVEASSMRLEVAASQRSSPSCQAEFNEQVLQLADSLENLPPLQREAIVLFYWQQQKVNDIAEQLDKTPAAVAGLLKRGLRALRDALNTQD